MKAFFLHRTYGSFGGQRSLTLIGNYLETQAPKDLSVDALEVNIYFRSEGPPRKTLESLYREFHQRLSDLPIFQYKKKKRSVRLEYLSQLGSAETIAEDRELVYDVFVGGFDEFLKALEAQKGKLSKHKLEPLLVWATNARLSAPINLRAMRDFESWYKEQRRHETESKSPWELLAVEWDDFHKEARQILDDPFYWESANDYAPHGNDTGADFLSLLRKYNPERETPEAFLQRVLDAWGMKSSISKCLAKRIEDTDSNDEIALTTFDEASIALAFGMIKLYGRCDSETITLALAAIEREVAIAARFGELPAERREALSKLRHKLDEISAGSGK